MVASVSPDIHKLRLEFKRTTFSDELEGPITSDEMHLFNQLLAYIRVLKDENELIILRNRKDFKEKIVKDVTGQPFEEESQNHRFVYLVVEAMTSEVEFL